MNHRLGALQSNLWDDSATDDILVLWGQPRQQAILVRSGIRFLSIACCRSSSAALNDLSVMSSPVCDSFLLLPSYSQSHSPSLVRQSYCVNRLRKRGMEFAKNVPTRSSAKMWSRSSTMASSPALPPRSSYNVGLSNRRAGGSERNNSGDQNAPADQRSRGFPHGLACGERYRPRCSPCREYVAECILAGGSKFVQLLALLRANRKVGIEQQRSRDFANDATATAIATEAEDAERNQSATGNAIYLGGTRRRDQPTIGGIGGSRRCNHCSEHQCRDESWGFHTAGTTLSKRTGLPLAALLRSTIHVVSSSAGNGRLIK